MADARHIHVDSDLVFSVDGDPDSACDVTKLTFYLVYAFFHLLCRQFPSIQGALFSLLAVIIFVFASCQCQTLIVRDVTSCKSGSGSNLIVRVRADPNPHS